MDTAADGLYGCELAFVNDYDLIPQEEYAILEYLLLNRGKAASRRIVTIRDGRLKE